MLRPLIAVIQMVDYEERVLIDTYADGKDMNEDWQSSLVISDLYLLFLD